MSSGFTALHKSAASEQKVLRHAACTPLSVWNRYEVMWAKMAQECQRKPAHFRSAVLLNQDIAAKWRRQNNRPNQPETKSSFSFFVSSKSSRRILFRADQICFAPAISSHLHLVWDSDLCNDDFYVLKRPPLDENDDWATETSATGVQFKSLEVKRSLTFCYGVLTWVCPRCSLHWPSLLSSPPQYFVLLLCIFLLEILAGILAYIYYQQVIPSMSVTQN